MTTHTVYKYRAINKYLLDSLIKGKLHFSTPKDLNDPFDCQVDLIKSFTLAQANDSLKQNKILQEEAQEVVAEELISKVSESLQGLEHLNLFKKKSSNLGVCSFSKKGLDPVMWSHYANDHRGVCLKYEFEDKFIHDNKNFWGIFDVEYNDNAVVNKFLRNMVNSQLHYDRSITLILVTAKGKEWGYEREKRIVRGASGGVEIPRSCLKEVCMGLRTSKEDALLLKEITLNNYSNVGALKIVRKKAKDFGIKTIPVNWNDI